MAESFESGAEIVRALAQGPGLPDVIRVSDEEETQGSLALSGPRGLTGRLFGGYLGLRRRGSGCLVIAGFEGDEESVARRRARAVRELRSGGAAYLGQAAGRSWEHGRYQGPYLRDTLMGMGAMVETLETSHTWSRLGELHAGVAAAIHGSLAGQGTPGLVFCHSRTPTPTAPRSTSPSSPAAATAPSWSSGGRSSAPPRRRSSPPAARSPTTTPSAATTPPRWRPRWGGRGLDVLRAVKDQLDPAGIMNPQKLLP